MPRAVARPHGALASSDAPASTYPTTRGARLSHRCPICGVTPRSSTPRADLSGALAAVAMFAIVLLGSGCSRSDQNFAVAGSVLGAFCIFLVVWVTVVARRRDEPRFMVVERPLWCGCIDPSGLDQLVRGIWDAHHPHQIMRGLKGPKRREFCCYSMKYRDVEFIRVDAPAAEPAPKPGSILEVAR